MLAETSQISQINVRVLIHIGTLTIRHSTVVVEPVTCQDREVPRVHDAIEIKITVVVIGQVKTDAIEPKHKAIIPRISVNLEILYS